jgi:GT2 family glycosyltransferase
MTSRPLLTLSIVSHGHGNMIARLLTSLQEHETYTNRFQLIITDNLKEDLPAIAPSPWHSLHILRNLHPQGFARNHNQAFKHAEGEYFAILNPDLLFIQPVFESLLHRLRHAQAHLIAPQIVDANGAPQDSTRPLPTPWDILRRRLPGYKYQPPIPDSAGLIYPEWMAGMFILLASDTYRQLGGMDERFRLYFEDVDFCARARLQGMRLMVDTRLQVRHDAQRASRKHPYYLFLHLQSAVRFFTSPVYKNIKRTSTHQP